jgi:transcriptional regulator with XRE-family HTH domain
MGATLQLKSVDCQQPIVFASTTVSCNNNKMTTLAMRLREAREAAGYTQQDLAKEAGIKQQSLQKIESGLTHNPRRLQVIESILGLPPGYLLYGEERDSELPKPIIARCPILKPHEVAEWPENKAKILADNNNRLASKIVLSGNCFAFQIQDDAMVNYLKAEGFQENRYILVDPEREARINDYVLAKRDGQDQLLFRKYINVDGAFELKPLNNMAFKNIKVTPDIKIKGVIVAYLDLLV